MQLALAEAYFVHSLLFFAIYFPFYSCRPYVKRRSRTLIPRNVTSFLRADQSNVSRVCPLSVEARLAIFFASVIRAKGRRRELLEMESHLSGKGTRDRRQHVANDTHLRAPEHAECFECVRGELAKKVLSPLPFLQSLSQWYNVSLLSTVVEI